MVNWERNWKDFPAGQSACVGGLASAKAQGAASHFGRLAKRCFSFFRKYPNGGNNPLPGGCLTMQIKTQPVPVEDVQAAIPLGNCDVCEDASFLVNRLYYAVPKFEGGQFQCALYYEENTFRKEKDGDLTLVRTEYGVEAT